MEIVVKQSVQELLDVLVHLVLYPLMIMMIKEMIIMTMMIVKELKHQNQNHKMMEKVKKIKIN